MLEVLTNLNHKLDSTGAPATPKPAVEPDEEGRPSISINELSQMTGRVLNIVTYRYKDITWIMF